jgi:hypothetical protein
MGVNRLSMWIIPPESLGRRVEVVGFNGIEWSIAAQCGPAASVWELQIRSAFPAKFGTPVHRAWGLAVPRDMESR